MWMALMHEVPASPKYASLQWWPGANAPLLYALSNNSVVHAPGGAHVSHPHNTTLKSQADPSFLHPCVHAAWPSQ